MERDAFLTALQTSCKKLMRFFAERGREWLATIMTQGTDPELGRLSTDRIYELLCYLSLLGDLSEKVNLRPKPAPGPQGYRFPYGPGNKANFAFFRFIHHDQTYDLCCGTGIPCEDEHFEHPDISLQKMPSEDSPPDPGKPVAIWDAKYHEKVMPKGDLAQMNLWCDLLNLQPYSEDDILEQTMPRQFQVTAVITNTKRSENLIYKQQSLKKGFSLVFDYKGPGTGTDPEPSREEHLKAQPKRQK